MRINFVRRPFFFKRKLVSLLSHCARKTLKLYLTAACPGEAVPGAGKAFFSGRAAHP
jgi:hypothetical protein